MMIRDDGTVIRTPVEKISVFSRNTQGVRLMRVDEAHKGRKRCACAAR